MAQRPLWVMSGHAKDLVNIRFSPEKTASNCCLRERLANVEPHAGPEGHQHLCRVARSAFFIAAPAHLPPIAAVISV